jgi:AraC-like DNA-binding protein
MARKKRDDIYLRRLREVGLRTRDEPSWLTRCSPAMRIVDDWIAPTAWGFAERVIGDHEVLYAKTGRGTFTLDGREFPFSAHTALIIPPRVPHGVHGVGGSHMLSLHFDLIPQQDSTTADYLLEAHDHRRTTLRSALPRRATEPGYLPPTIALSGSHEFERLFSVLKRFFPLVDPASRLAVKAAMLELLSLLYRAADLRRSPADHHDRASIQRALDHIADCYGQHLTLQSIAAHCSMSSPSLARLFRRQSGQTLMNYVRRLRVERAKSAMLQKDHPLKAIAEECGFANVHHFTRVFTTVVGLSPAAWRQSLSGNPG